MDPKEWKHKWAEIMSREFNKGKVAQDVSIRDKQSTHQGLDTQLRKEIQKTIIELLRKCETPESIIKKLSDNSNYEKYKIYFPIWIEHLQRKIQPQKQREEEER